MSRTIQQYVQMVELFYENVRSVKNVKQEILHIPINNTVHLRAPLNDLLKKSGLMEDQRI